MRRWTGMALGSLILAGCGSHDATGTYKIALTQPGLAGPSIMPVSPGLGGGPVGSPGLGIGPVASPLGRGPGAGGPGTATHEPVCFGVGVCPPLEHPPGHRPPHGRFPPAWRLPHGGYPPVWAPPVAYPVPQVYGPGGGVIDESDPVAERIMVLQQRLDRLLQLRQQAIGVQQQMRIDQEIQAIREELTRLGVDV